MSLKIKSLTLAIVAVSSTSLTHAAGLDRSTQPSWAFTEPGTLAYIEHITIDPTIEGKDNAQFPATSDNFVAGQTVPDMAQDYQFLNFGAKADLNDTVTLGAFFDQPWGADVSFTGDNNFVGSSDKVIGSLFSAANLPGVTNVATAKAYIAQAQTQLSAGQAQLTAAKTQVAQAQALLASNPALAPVLQPRIDAGLAQIATGEKLLADNTAKLNQFRNLTNIASNLDADKSGTKVSVDSQNFTGLVGVKVGENKNFQIYGGPTLQRLEGSVHLRGDAYETATGYDAGIAQSTGVGWMAGVAYTKPEIALKAALTYRSEIDHDTRINENLPLAALRGINPVQVNDATITTPQSVNVDFQTGLNPTTLLTAKLRWVPWSDFAIKPPVYGGLSGLNLVSYDKDGWTAELGLGKKLSQKFAVSGAVGWDSGAGNPITSLGPVEGNWNVGLGAKYNFTPEWAISGGAKYLMFGDAKAKIPNGHLVGDFQDNDGMVYGIRLSYQKK